MFKVILVCSLSIGIFDWFTPKDEEPEYRPKPLERYEYPKPPECKVLKKNNKLRMDCDLYTI